MDRDDDITACHHPHIPLILPHMPRLPRVPYISRLPGMPQLPRGPYVSRVPRISRVPPFYPLYVWFYATACDKLTKQCSTFQTLMSFLRVQYRKHPKQLEPDILKGIFAPPCHEGWMARSGSVPLILRSRILKLKIWDFTVFRSAANTWVALRHLSTHSTLRILKLFNIKSLYAIAMWVSDVSDW